MRTIKFRVYSTYERQMIYEDLYDYLSIDSNGQLNNSAGLGEFHIMQFTGLHDKNGKEVYEGDVVRILYTDWASKTNEKMSLDDYKKSISHFGYVVYDNAEYSINIKSKKYNDYYNSSIHHGTHGEIEIIGNIYENPELLEQ